MDKILNVSEMVDESTSAFNFFDSNELAELRKDKARLDWLETQGCLIRLQDEYFNNIYIAPGIDSSHTVRGVCDMAMK